MRLRTPVVFPLLPIVAGKCTCNRETCGSVGKHPAVPWGELKLGDSVPRPAPGAGVGLKTGALPKGSDVIVVDLDGEDAIRRFEELGGAPPTYTVSTPRSGGGQHRYLNHPGFPVKNSAGLLARGIDIRGDGGFVVAAGSPHLSGGTYEVIDDRDPVDAPEWLLAWLRSEFEAAGPPREVQPYPGDVTDAAELEYRHALFAAHCTFANPAAEGQRHVALFPIVQYGAFHLALPVADVLDIVATHYNPRCNPPMGSAELSESVAGHAHGAKTRSTTERRDPRGGARGNQTVGDSTDGTRSAGPTSATGTERRGLGFIYSAWDQETPPVEFIVDGLIPKGSIVMFYGKSDSMKTWLLFSMSIALANGTPWLGFAIDKPLKVGIVDYETGKVNVRRRLYMLRAGANPNLGAVSFADPKPNTPAFWKELAKEALDVVIVDSLRRANPGADENDSAEGIVPLELAGEFSESTGTTVIWIHHAKKGSADGWPEYRGSGAIEDQVDAAFAVRKIDVSAETKRMEIRCEKPGDMRLPAPFSVDISFDDTAKRTNLTRATLTGPGTSDTPIVKISEEGTIEQISAEIRLALANGPIASRGEIQDRIGKNRARVKAALDGLIKRGEVTDRLHVGLSLDDDDQRQARVFALVRRPRGPRTIYALAKAASVGEHFVQNMIFEGVLAPAVGNNFRSGFVVVEIAC